MTTRKRKPLPADVVAAIWQALEDEAERLEREEADAS